MWADTPKFRPGRDPGVIFDSPTATIHPLPPMSNKMLISMISFNIFSGCPSLSFLTVAPQFRSSLPKLPCSPITLLVGQTCPLSSAFYSQTSQHSAWKRLHPRSKNLQGQVP